MRREYNKKAANKIDGIVALAMASLGAVKEQAQSFEVLGARVLNPHCY
jgi:phage terminase large subunit-like protein